MAEQLTLKVVYDAVAKSAAAFRCRTKLQPAGGDGDKVFPPTYAGGVYATERRRIDGKEVPCVLLDSVQSQANRLEEALLAAYDDGRLEFPVLSVDFSEFQDIGRITTLDAPHRLADAIFRDSQLNGKDFRDSPEGMGFEAANIRNATALYELCPTALVFGTWDSTGSRGGLGHKFARAIVSEIVGVNCVAGVRTSSRIDPLQISSKVPLYAAKGGGWTLSPDDAQKDDKKAPIPYQSKAGKGNPSAINHSNVTPGFAKYAKGASGPDPLKEKRVELDYRIRSRDGEFDYTNRLRAENQAQEGQIAAGGVTLDYALQTAVLSLPALRRLRFPDGDGSQSAERNTAARTVLAALGLAALAEQRQLGYFLRSRCDLVPESGTVEIELVRSTGNVDTFELTPDSAASLFGKAVSAAREEGLEWRLDLPPLQPQQALVELVRKSREILAAEGEDA